MRKVKDRVVQVLTGTIIAAAWLAIGCAGRPASDATPTGPSAGPAASTKNGNDIITEFLKRDAAPYRRQRVRFTITEENGEIKVYEIDNWRKQTPAETLTLTRIVKPAEDSDLGSLTAETEGNSTVVTSYVASQDRFRETDTGKIFFGGLTAGELLGEWKKFDFKLKGEKDIDGRMAYLLDGKIKEGMSSVAARMTVTVMADNFLPSELKLFDNTDRELRTYKITEAKGDAARPYAARTEVDNLVYKARIVIEILEREFPASLDDRLFSRDKLKEFAKN